MSDRLTLPRCEYSGLERIGCDCPACESFTMDESELRLRGSKRDAPPNKPREHRVKLASLPEYRSRHYGEQGDVQPALSGHPCATCTGLAGDAFLCPRCVDDIERILGDVPAMVEDLEVALQRRVRFTLSPGGSTETPLPYDPKAGEMLDTLRNELVGAIRMLTEERGLETPKLDSVEAMSRWLLTHAQSIALDVAGEDICLGLRAIHTKITRQIDRPPPKIYLGRCDACNHPVYARAGATTAYCRATGCVMGLVPIDVETALARLEERVHGELRTVGGLIEVAHWAGHKVTRRRVKYLIESGRLLRCGRTREGDATYLVGDLLGLIAHDAREGA